MTKPLAIDLLLFDLDGTLTDSIPPAIVAVQAMLQELNLPIKSKLEIESYVGFGEIPLISNAIGSREPKLLQKALDSYYRRYREEGLPQVKLYPGVKETLEHFRSKKMIIISNKKLEFIEIILKNYGLRNLFAEVYGGDNAPCLKPEPCLIHELLDKYQVKPDRAMLVGDMVVDIKAARNAGVYVAAATYGFEAPLKLQKAQPDFLLDNFSQLKELVE